MITKLPDKPSELIQLALDDLEKCEQADNDIVINMGSWAYYEDLGYDGGVTCEVCFAGSVLVQTVGLTADRFDWTASDYYDVCPSEIGEYLEDVTDDEVLDLRDKCYALNSFRVGRIDKGLKYLNLLEKFKPAGTTPIPGAGETPFPSYHREPDRFKQRMRQIVYGFDLVGY